jgi:hypothetical protein
MTHEIRFLPTHRSLLCLAAALLLTPLSYAQVTLTGAIQFSTNSSGAFSAGVVSHWICDDDSARPLGGMDAPATGDRGVGRVYDVLGVRVGDAGFTAQCGCGLCGAERGAGVSGLLDGGLDGAGCGAVAGVASRIGID